jgi:hypothetical protein
VDRIFTIEEARDLLPRVIARADEFITVRADLIELRAALRHGESSPLGGLPEAKALEARFDELLNWFPARALELKGAAPLLLDFPSRIGGEPVLLCWLEGDRELAWYHKPEHGFAGRRRIPADASGG